MRSFLSESIDFGVALDCEDLQHGLDPVFGSANGQNQAPASRILVAVNAIWFLNGPPLASAVLAQFFWRFWRFFGRQITGVHSVFELIDKNSISRAVASRHP